MRMLPMFHSNRRGNDTSRGGAAWFGEVAALRRLDAYSRRKKTAVGPGLNAEYASASGSASVVSGVRLSVEPGWQAPSWRLEEGIKPPVE
jgi:hypothetical protein